MAPCLSTGDRLSGHRWSVDDGSPVDDRPDLEASTRWAGIRDRLLVEQAVDVRDVFAADVEDEEDEEHEAWPEHG